MARRPGQVSGHRASLSRGPRAVFRSSILPSEWSCQGRTRAKFGFFGCRTILLVCRRGTAGTAVWTPRPVPAAIYYSKFRVLVAGEETRVVRKLRAARNASDIPFAPLGNPGATADRPASGDKPKIRPRLSALARSCRTNGRAYIHQKAPQDTATNGKALASVQPRPRDRDHASRGQS